MPAAGMLLVILPVRDPGQDIQQSTTPSLLVLLQAATMTSKQDVLDAGDAFYQANTSLGCINAALPLTRKQARDEMKGVPRYPARCSQISSQSMYIAEETTEGKLDRQADTSDGMLIRN